MFFFFDFCVSLVLFCLFLFFFFNDTATTEIYTLSLHDALPISRMKRRKDWPVTATSGSRVLIARSEEHTSELQSPVHLVCRLLLEKKKNEKSSECQGVKKKKQTIHLWNMASE